MHIKKTGLIGLVLLTVAVMSVLLTLPSLISAQNQPIPVPPAPGTNEGDNGGQDDMQPVAIPDEELENYIKPVFRVRRPIEEYKVVYLADTQLGEFTNLVTPENLALELGAQTASSWDEVIGLHRESSIQSLIIHANALPMVDYAWVQNAYRSGVVITAIDFSWPELPEMLGTLHCEPSPRPSGSRDAAHFFATASYLVLGDNPDDVSKVLNARFERCLVDDEVEDDQLSDQLLMLTEKAGRLNLETEKDFLLFKVTIQNQLNDVETLRQELVMHGREN